MQKLIAVLVTCAVLVTITSCGRTAGPGVAVVNHEWTISAMDLYDQMNESVEALGQFPQALDVERYDSGLLADYVTVLTDTAFFRITENTRTGKVSVIELNIEYNAENMAVTAQGAHYLAALTKIIDPKEYVEILQFAGQTTFTQNEVTSIAGQHGFYVFNIVDGKYTALIYPNK